MKNEDITIYGDGMQTRTFCYIDDNIDACVNIFRQKKFINDVVNIGNDDEITILELAETIIKVTKSKSKIVFLPKLEEGDMPRRQPDLYKMRKIFTKKHFSLEEGLKKTLKKGLFELDNDI